MPGQFSLIRGDAGFITAAAGAKVGIISKWVIKTVRMKPDGRPEMQFKAQFSWKNDALMNMVARGTLKGRVVVQMRTKYGQENVDVLAWQEWKMDGDVLILEDVLQYEGVVQR